MDVSRTLVCIGYELYVSLTPKFGGLKYEDLGRAAFKSHDWAVVGSHSENEMVDSHQIKLLHIVYI